MNKPTAKQVAMLESLGLEIPNTREEASDLIAVNIDKPTPKQVAKLEYMGLKVPSTKEDASDLLDEIEEDPAYEEKRIDWDLEKYDLHPDLYDETGEEMEKRWHRKAKRSHENSPLGCAPLIVLAVFIGTLCTLFSVFAD